MLKYSQSNRELKKTKDEFIKTKEKLNKDNINEKTKYINELKEIQKKLKYQNDIIKKFKSKLNDEEKNIKTLKDNNKNLEIEIEN